MALALSLAGRGLGQVWPNPAVGCVLVRDGRIVGRGWTQPGGRPHAETVALAQAGADARGCTAYVTLEPCAHHGKTPPCADALIAAGVSRVVCAGLDPDPRVSGKGFDMLRAAGIAVDTGLLEAEASRLQRGFLYRIGKRRPLVTLKLATSIDGRIATAAGESRWITGPEARRQVHALRLRHDAVLVGGGTARADDPSLTVRGFGAVRQPVRVVASALIDLPKDGALACSAREVPLWLIHGPGADAGVWQAIGAETIETPLSGGRIDPAAMLWALADRGITRVFCEGGGALAANLLKADLVDDLVVHRAGLALGADARAGIGELGLGRLDEAPRFRLVDQSVAGDDSVETWSRD